MIISKVKIEKFRKFNNIEFNLGKKITIIAGQNGAMKTTLLGLIGHPFSLNNKKYEIHKARTIDGYAFGSKFSDKFVISHIHENAGDHRYTLYFTGKDVYYGKDRYAAKSIARKVGGELQGLRIWSAEGNEENMGYVQVPVIYLSLKRLVPIGEEKATASNPKLSDDEIELFKSYHNEILLLDDDLKSVEYVKSSNKSSLGVKTATYDSLTNSAGQDNIGKILLSILSFKRLQDEYPNDYKGGILLIDELDATMFPRSQEKLIKSLFHFSAKYNIQIICTTHSLSTLNAVMDKKYANDRAVLYLRARSTGIIVDENPPFDQIRNDLTVSVSPKVTPQKIRLYCEDSEAFVLFAGLIPREYKSRLMPMKMVKLGAGNFLDLARKKIPEFCSNIVVLDGDQKPKRRPPNFCILPGDGLSPERMFFQFLKKLSDADDFWDSALAGYSKQVCFSDYSGHTPKDRDEYKKWFNTQAQSKHWGKGCIKLINRWKKDHTEIVDAFVKQFVTAFEYVAKLHR